MTTIAQQVRIACQGAQAYTLYGGYAMDANGVTTRFPQGVQERERRNSDGRCTYARYSYADGSRIEFRWSERAGSTLITSGAPV